MDPLQWWKVNSARFPRLAAVARKYLYIPATSVPYERVFSFAGHLVSKRRCSLSADMIDVLIFLHINAGLLKLAVSTEQRQMPALILAPAEDDEDGDGKKDMPPLPSLQALE